MAVDPLTISLILALLGFITGLDSYSTKSLLALIPLMAGFISGLILGDLIAGAYIGGYVQLISLGLVPIGGAVPPDFAVVTVILVALTATGIITLEQVPTVFFLIVPAGILSMYLDIFARTINVSVIRSAERLIERGDVEKGFRIHFMGLIPLAGFRALAYFIPSFIVFTVGINALKTTLESMPVWILRGLSVGGALLPALGIGILLSYLGFERNYKALLIPFLIVALINFPYTFSLVLIVAGVIAWRRLRRAARGGGGTKRESYKLSSSTLRKMIIRSGFLLECSWNYERMQALGYLYAIYPALKEIYGDSEEKMREALETHLEFFNTNPFFAPMIVGMDAATEETNPGDFDLIRNLKIGLMGTFAGLGDSLIYLVIGGILLIVGSTLAKQAVVNPMLAWVPLITFLIFDSIFIPFRFYVGKLGYERGLGIAESFAGEKIGPLRETFEWLAFVSIGALLPTIMSVRLFIAANVLTGIDATLGIISLNQFVGAVIGLVFVYFAYYLRRKGKSPLFLLGVLFALGFILGALGILSVVAETVTE